MSEPRRWRDTPDAPVGMRELLGSAKPTRPLDERAFRRGAQRVAKLSVAPAAIAVGASVWTKLAAAAVVGLAAVGTTVAIEARHPDAPRAPTTAPSVPAVVAAQPMPATPDALPVPPDEPAPSTVTPSPVVKPAFVATTVTVTPAPAPVAPSAVPESPWVPDAPARSKSSLSDELGLLESARSQMARSPQTALDRLAEHRARFPTGALAAERDLMELDLLRRTGRADDARVRASDWLARDPNGLHATRVRAILASLEP